MKAVIQAAIPPALKFLAFVLLISGGIYARYGNPWKKEHVFQKFTVEQGDIFANVTSVGSVAPRERLEVKAPVDGRVETINVKAGDFIHQGDILAMVSTTDRAALIDGGRSEGKTGRALASLEKEYPATPVIAPMTGTVIERNVEPGQSFTSVDPIFVLSDALGVQAVVDETDIGEIRLHQKAQVVLDAYDDHVIQAVVDHIAYEAKTVNNVTTYRVDLVLQDTPDYVRSGMTANVTYPGPEHRQVPLIASAAIRTENGGPYVTVLKHGNVIHKKIALGIVDGKRTEVLHGLHPGDEVLAEVQTPKGKGPATTSIFARPHPPRNTGGSKSARNDPPPPAS